MVPFIPLTLPSFLSSRRLRPRRRHLQITVTVDADFAVAPLVTPARDGEEVRPGVGEEGDFFTSSLNLSLFGLWRLRMGRLWTTVSIYACVKVFFATNTQALAAANCYTSHSAGNILLPAPISAMEKWELSQMKREEKRGGDDERASLGQICMECGVRAEKEEKLTARRKEGRGSRERSR